MHHYTTAGPSPEVIERLQHALGAAYEIERELGGGGMSRIFLAREVALGRRVVVKLLPPEYAAGVNGERFHREILLAARLQHPHIVPILSAGEMNGVPYYTMPFIEGESLRTRLLRGDHLSPLEVTRILHDVIDALAYAHEHGVVHRDIKPDNVLMSRQHAVITDFGVAKALCDAAHEAGCADCDGASQETGLAIGTPAYMAPEQAAADPSTDHRADIYGFGVLAYELITGQPPFSGREPLELLAAHVAETPVPIDALQPDVPQELAELIMRCLEKHPESRPASAGEIRDALSAMSLGVEYASSSGQRAVRAGSQLSRIAAAVVLAVVGTGAALMGAHERLNEGQPAVADASGKPRRGELLGPGLVEARWVGQRRDGIIQLPAVAAHEPERATERVAKRAPASVARAERAAANGGGSVHVVISSKHGVATAVVESERSTARIRGIAERLGVLEAMVGEESVVAMLPAVIDTLSLERRGARTEAKLILRERTPPTPRAGSRPAPSPRPLPDGAGSSAGAADADVDDAPLPPRAPLLIRAIDLENAADVIASQSRSTIQRNAECIRAEAQRLLERLARQKDRRATS